MGRVTRVAANSVGASAALASSVSCSWAQPVQRYSLAVCAVVTDLNLDPTYAAPRGWSQIGATVAGIGGSAAWYWHTVDVDDGASVQMSWTGLAGQAALALSEYRGAKIVSPHEAGVAASASGLASANASVSGAGQAPAGDMLLLMIAALAVTSRSAFLDGFVERVYQSAAAVLQLSLADSEATVARTPVPGCTLGVSAAWAAAVAAFKPEPDKVYMPQAIVR